jgi:DNA polymerase elongation subunit (family B)
MNFYTNIQLVSDTILYRGYENGNRVLYRDKLSPTLFVPSKKETKHKTLDNQFVKPVKFLTVREARDFVKKYSEVDNFDIYGYERFLYQYIADKFPQDEIRFDMSKMHIICLDIEVECENGFPNVESASEEILCITIKDLNTKQLIVWGTREFQTDRNDVQYIDCFDEKTLLTKFLNWWVENTPDIVTGWNVYLYDIPYIARRLERVHSEKHMRSMSPWSLINYREFMNHGRKNIAYDIGGVSCLDYLDLYKKFTYTNQESYRLDHIASVELNEKKLDHSEYENFKAFYTYNWQKFVEYNIHDVELVDRMDDKMKLIELCLTMAYDAKENYEDVYSQVKTWDNIIFNYLKKDNIVVPPKIINKKDTAYAGAYVKEPKPGLYDYVVNFDLNSLYPHLIMQFNVSPETLVEERHPTVSVDKILNQQINLSEYKNYAVCPNGAMYRKDFQGFLPKLMEKMYNDRVIFKKKMIDAKKEYEKTPTVELTKEIARCNNIQMAKKISLNSAYGAIGNEYFRYFRIANAEAITLSGQVAIRWIEGKLNNYMNRVLKTTDVDYVIASDTDSIYLNMGPLVESVYQGRKKTSESVVSFLDKVASMELEKYIESSYQELADYVNAYQQKMQMKRENIADRGIWTAKKRYILNVWDSEGVRYETPKLKIMGLETARSSTPAYYRDKLYEAFKIIINSNNDSLIKFIDKIRIDSRNQDIANISFPRSLNNLEKYRDSANLYRKGTPIQVRGAILYNEMIKRHKLQSKYPMIQEGEKIKFVYLKEPNPIGENIIAYFQTLPSEFNLNKYIDYDMQFEKSFLEPLKSVLDTIGWQVERRGTLESFFT